MRTLPPIPYVVGQWVRGPAFYGRTELIAEILDGPRNAIWLLGTRRIGKTSLLKELERIADDRYFAMFWDLQGAEDARELGLTFDDALLDAEERLAAQAIDLDAIRDDDLFVSMKRLVRTLRSKEKKLLLLCDEVEELINLGRIDPGILRKLRHVVQGQEGIRSVFASTIRLWALAEQWGDTSPFLHGVTPPVYIQRLTDREARDLVLQTNLAEDERPAIDDAVVDEIRLRCDNHPYLMQLLCKRYAEAGDLEEATESVASDRMVAYFFSVDFDMLAAREREVLRVVSEHESATSETIRLRFGDEVSSTGELERLANLGFLNRGADNAYSLSNFFFRSWIRETGGNRGESGGAEGDWVSSYDATPAHPWPPGRIAERYQLLEGVGEGASSIVYRARDLVLETDIAIKLFRSEYSTSGEGLERLRQEVTLARNIAHPNVLRLYDVGSFRDRTYVTMQWVAGSTLAAAIGKAGPYEEAMAIEIAAKLASALGAAHARRVLHRDVKPGNVLLGEDREPYLADFGLARLIGAPGITSQGKFVGTPYYCSPEQANLRPLDERSDIYSLGVVMFEMATGRRPFESADRIEVLEMHRAMIPPDPRRFREELSKGFAGIVLRCLAKDPRDRFPSAASLETALREIDH